MNKFKIVLSIFVIFTMLLSVYSQSFVNAEAIKIMNDERYEPLSGRGVHLLAIDEGRTNANCSPTNENTKYVDNNTGENHYRDLRTAVNNSKNGDIIYVEPGFYKGNENSNITIDHNLTILGKNSNKIGIDVNNTKINSTTNTKNIFFSSDVVLDAEKQNNFFTIEDNVSLTLSNLTFINGFSQNTGGAITNKGNLTIDFSSFSNNTVTKPTNNDEGNWYDHPHDTPEDLENLSDKTKGLGGAIYSTNQLHILNSNFDTNIAGKACRGGAIFNSGEKIDINNTLFKLNIASDGGGAIYSENGMLSIDYSTFELNSASTYASSSGGGAIYAENTNIKIDSSIFMLNIASKSYGGAINNKDSSLTSNNNYFISNIADGGDGGAIYSLRNIKTSINGNLFTLNNASADGGAIYHKASKSFNLEKSVFVNDSANRGGAIYFGDSEEINSANSAFINNSCNSEGGSLYNDNSNVNIISNEFSGSNGKKGGAIYSTNDINSSLNVKDSILRDNNAKLDGGSLYSSTNNMNIKNNYLINNSATNNGGGIYLIGNNNDIDNSTFAVNIAIKGNGGAIYNIGSNLTNHNSNFEANYATEDGGAIWSDKTPQLKQNNYEKNMAKYGAALFSKENKSDETSSNFSDNYASYGGDNYYTQKQKDTAPGKEIGILIANIFAIILVTLASIFVGVTYAGDILIIVGTVLGNLGIALSNGGIVAVVIVFNILVGLIGMGVTMLAEYLFELSPEYKKFNERNPLLLPLITIAIVIVMVVLNFALDLIEFPSWIESIFNAISEGKTKVVQALVGILQHLDDVILIINYGVKAGAGTLGNNGHEPPDLSKYQNNHSMNNENQFFKGISFNYNDIEVYLKDYNISNMDVTHCDENSGVCDFNFKATPKNSSYPMLYGKGTYNVMNYYMVMDLFTLSDYNPSSNLYSWKGYNSDAFNIQ
jgi:predicted outer membrane repeat protein